MSKLVYVPGQESFIDSIGTTVSELSDATQAFISSISTYDNWGEFMCAEFDNAPDVLKAYALRKLLADITEQSPLAMLMGALKDACK